MKREENLRHKIRVGWLKYKPSLRLFRDCCIPIRLKKKSYKIMIKPSNDLWNIRLPNKETTRVRNECSKDKNIKTDFW